MRKTISIISAFAIAASAVFGNIMTVPATQITTVTTTQTESGQIKIPSAPGYVTYGNNSVTVDASNVNEGYFMVNYHGTNPKVKMQVISGTTYTYDINARGSYESFPLTNGNGNYQIKIFENAGGNMYSQLLSQTISVSNMNEFSPFLYPNQYVNFNENSNAVQVANSLAAGNVPIIVVKAIYEYVIKNVSYDYQKASYVQSGYLPNIDSTLATKSGICFDYASLMCAMLRSQGIPTKLVIGYTGDVYHAWVSVYIQGQGWIDDMIYFDGQNWSIMDPTFISSSGGSQAAKQHVSNKNNYFAKFSY